MEKLEKYYPLVGRILLGLIFLMAGLHKIGDWDGTAHYMASKNMPLIPLFLVGAIAFEVLGSLSIITGFKAKWGALALFLFLIPVTFIFHDFWNITNNAMMQQIQMLMFMKNFAIMGGLLLLAANGPGELSLDHKLRK